MSHSKAWLELRSEELASRFATFLSYWKSLGIPVHEQNRRIRTICRIWYRRKLYRLAWMIPTGNTKADRKALLKIAKIIHRLSESDTSNPSPPPTPPLLPSKTHRTTLYPTTEQTSELKP